jgi:hypothetical protein
MIALPAVVAELNVALVDRYVLPEMSELEACWTWLVARALPARIERRHIKKTTRTVRIFVLVTIRIPS